MEKVLLAVGHRQLEEYLEEKLKDEFLFIGTTVYREGIITAIEDRCPDIVVIRETLEGSLNIMKIVYDIRANYPSIRIIFLAGNREVGDELLATLVNYGVYDILYGESIPAQKIIGLIRQKNSYNEIKHLQPIPILDEDRNKVMFKDFDTTEIEDEVNTDTDDDKSDEEVEEKKNIVKEHKRKIVNVKIPQINLIKKEVKNQEKEIKYEQIETTNEKIITFVGGKNGTSTTTLAMNTAFLLAEDEKKVIFVEINEKYPQISYLYDLGYVSEGIDTALDGLMEKKYDKVKSAIVKTEDIRKEKSPMQKNYRKFPKLLDFLFFSKEYLSGIKEPIDLSVSRELYLYLIYQLDYDFVIIDVPSDLANKATIDGIIFSNKVFTVITQDVSSIGYSLFNLNELEKKGIEIKNKNHFIVNKHVKSNFKDNEIKNWIDCSDLITVDECSKEFINANLEGIPAIINSKNNDLIEDINRIKNNILKK